MPVEIDYDFKSPKKEESQEIRKNLRIVRCCSNCKFFVPGHSPGKGTGFCKYPYTGQKKLKEIYGDYEKAREQLTKTHRTLLCDSYQLRSKFHITVVGDWIGKKFLNDGTLQNE